MNEKQYRHEVKHEIGKSDMLILRQRLRAVMSADAHAENGIYEIRSLYFDTPDDKALREKLCGVKIREKFRIRLYNNSKDMIRLERKFKNGQLGFKDSARLTKDEVRAILAGDIGWMADSKDELILLLYTRMKYELLRPKVIVDYTREPFVFSAGNVRVTLDSNIRTGLGCTDILDPSLPTVPIIGDPCILEVKWDNFLPSVIRDAAELDTRRSGAFSKYAACRMFD